MKQLIIVNEKDQVLGFEEKKKCLDDKGILHRAFSIFVFNPQGELLIQKRSRFKRLWPLFWSNTCCSHPLKEEEIKKTAGQRLQEELGFTCPLEFLFKFLYRASFKDKGSENELVHVFKGIYNPRDHTSVTAKYEGEVKPDEKEVADWRWLFLEDLEKEIKEKPESFTPWFKSLLNKFQDKFRKE